MSDTKQQTHTIEHLDFEAELPCENSAHSSGRFGHNGYAWALIARTHPCNQPLNPSTYLICRGGWEGTPQVHCATCGARGSRDEMWQVVEVLR